MAFTAPVTSHINAVEQAAGGNVIAAFSTLTVSVAPTLNQFVGMVPIPARSRIVGATLSFTDMDTNASPTLAVAVGDAATPARLIAATTGPGTGAGITSALVRGGHGYLYTTDTLVGVTFTAVAATFAAGSIELTLMYIQE